MGKYFYLLLVNLLLASCYTYQLDSTPPNKLHFAPPIETQPEIYERAKNLPEKKVILLEEEYAYSSKPVKPWLRGLMQERNFDGSIINHRSFSASDYYGNPQHYVEHQPFIYLDRFEERNFFDYITVQVWDENGDSLRFFRLEFDWNSQLKFFPSAMTREDYDVIAIQPWFFLQQTNKLWRTAIDYPGNWPRRTFGAGMIYYHFIPRLNSDAYIVKRSGFRVQVNLKSSAGDVPEIGSLSRNGEKLDYRAEDFFGRIMKQNYTSPKGLKYELSYHYKSIEDIPQNWIVGPEDLQ